MKQPDYETTYDVTIGKSILNPNENSTQYHNLQYNIKPKLLDTTKPANVSKSQQGVVHIQYNHINNPNEKYNYSGNYKPCKEYECLLIFENGQFRLEKQTGNVVLMKKDSTTNFLIGTIGNSTSNQITNGTSNTNDLQAPLSKKLKSNDSGSGNNSDNEIFLPPLSPPTSINTLQTGTVPPPNITTQKQEVSNSNKPVTNSNNNSNNSKKRSSTNMSPPPITIPPPFNNKRSSNSTGNKPTVIKPPSLPNNNNNSNNSSTSKSTGISYSQITREVNQRNSGGGSNSSNNQRGSLPNNQSDEESFDDLAKDLEFSFEKGLENELTHQVENNLDLDDEFVEYPVQQKQTNISNNMNNNNNSNIINNNNNNTITTSSKPSTLTEADLFSSLNESYSSFPNNDNDDIDFGQNPTSPPHKNTNIINNNSNTVKYNNTGNNNNNNPNPLLNQSIDSIYTSDASDSYTDESDSDSSSGSSSDSSSESSSDV